MPEISLSLEKKSEKKPTIRHRAAERLNLCDKRFVFPREDGAIFLLHVRPGLMSFGVENDGGEFGLFTFS